MIAYQMDNPSHNLKSAFTYTNMVEVFVDNFIAATNNLSLSHLTVFFKGNLTQSTFHNPFPSPKGY